MPKGSLTALLRHITLKSGPDRWNSPRGDLLVIPGSRHFLKAVSDSVVLLTVAE